MRSLKFCLVLMLIPLPVFAESACDRPLITSDNSANISPDLAFLRHVAKSVGCRIELAPYSTSYSRRLLLLREGKIDVLTLASKRIERTEYAYFSDAYRQEQYVLFVRPENSRAYLTPLDLITQRIPTIAPSGGWFGPTWEIVYPLLQQKRLIQQYDSYEQGLRLLYATPVRGEVLLGDYALMRMEAQRLGLIIPKVNSFPINSEPTHLMFSKRSITPELVSAFDEAIQKQRGFFTSIEMLPVNSPAFSQAPQNH